MTLPPGRRLGPFEILAPLGAGGMGEVYRAKDTRLERLVALKVLPEEFSGDMERRRRFEHEARSASALNHPNIVTLHEIGSADGILFVAMELVDGETLRSLLKQGPLPLPKALDCAAQIAEGLAKAHDANIVHRDLKPENLIVSTDGFVKILDFGLAKVQDPLPRENPSDLPMASMTEPGTVMGTVGYMSPEQASGRPVDFRSDQFAFGCILHEMLSGRRAFARPTVVETLTAIIREEPDPLPAPDSPTASELQEVARRCLAKGPEDRFASTHELAATLKRLQRNLPAQPPVKRWNGPLILLSAASILAAGLAGAALLRRPSARAFLPLRMRQITFAPGIEASPAWAPDGQALAYTADAGPVRKIFLKRLASSEEAQLTKGDHDDLQPAWASDGRTLYFVRGREAGRRLQPGDPFGEYAGGDIWALDLSTGSERLFCENGFNPAPSPDGARVAFDASRGGPRRIWAVDTGGHNPVQLSTDTSEQIAHLRPRWSPDGKRIAFYSQDKARFAVHCLDLAARQQRPVASDGFVNMLPDWSPSGKFIYFSSYRSGINIWRQAIDAASAPRGAPEQVTTGAGEDVEVAFSKDGKAMAFSVLKQNADLYLLPVSSATGLPTGEPRPVVASSREDSRGALSPDGSTVAFNSDRDGDMNIWLHDRKRGTDRQLTRGGGGDYQPAWSPDGARVVFFSSRSGHPEIWSAEVATGELAQLTHEEGISASPKYSPDGKSIAFQSDRSGRLEVWIMEATGKSPRQLTQTGVNGHFLLWSRDGAHVVFMANQGEHRVRMQVPAAGGAPEPLPDIKGGSHISFSPDFTKIMDVIGHRTLWVSPVDGGAPAKVFEFPDPEDRIDFPVWLKDGSGVLFDRFHPEGGDLWMAEGFE